MENEYFNTLLNRKPVALKAAETASEPTGNFPGK